MDDPEIIVSLHADIEGGYFTHEDLVSTVVHVHVLALVTDCPIPDCGIGLNSILWYYSLFQIVILVPIFDYGSVDTTFECFILR